MAILREGAIPHRYGTVDGTSKTRNGSPSKGSRFRTGTAVAEARGARKEEKPEGKGANAIGMIEMMQRNLQFHVRWI